MVGENRISLPYYRIKRGDTRFFAMYRGSEKNKLFRDLKKRGIVNDRMLEAVIGNISYFLHNWCDVVTVPPHSGVGKSWAAMIANKIAGKIDAEFITIFKDHNLKKRMHISKKFKNIKCVEAVHITGRRVLLFDDFTLTGGTMRNTLDMLNIKNDVIGIVIGC